MPTSPIVPELSFSSDTEFADWQQRLRVRLREMLVLPADSPLPLEAERTPESETDSYTTDRIRFVAEPGEVVPGFLLRPKIGRAPFPVMICLQGHTPGMHLSLGRANSESEVALLEGGRDIALQAVANGWAALVIEQRAFGERARPNTRCNDAALHALLWGRPLLGGRVFDVQRALDFIALQPDLDSQRIGCLGNSTGGTVSFYAACVDSRIALAVVSCSFCSLEDSWLSLPHCACGYLPGLARVADLPDCAGLIAPRRLLIVAGKQDKLARFEGVQRGFERTRQIFQSIGCENHVRFVAGEGGHQFYPELAWPVIGEMMEF
jgi:hypothetical protein